MPIFTFRCPRCSTEVERILKVSERDAHQEQCPCGEMLVWAGVEGKQAHRPNGKYELKGVAQDGSRVAISHNKGKRSDW